MESRVQSEKRGNWTERASDNAPGVTYILPEPEPEGARVWFFTRRGGVSEPPYESLNVSTKVGDEDTKVRENLARIKSAVNGRASAWTRLVAGSEVVRVMERISC